MAELDQQTGLKMSRSPKLRTVHVAHHSPMVKEKRRIKVSRKPEEHSHAWSMQEGDRMGRFP